MTRLYIGHRGDRLIIFIEYRDIKSCIADLIFIKLSQASLANLVDGAVYLLPAERFYAGNATMPFTRPSGEHQLIIGQSSHKLGLLLSLSAFLHLFFT